MTYTIDLLPEENERLRRIAAERGLDVQEYLRRTIRAIANDPGIVGDEEFDQIAHRLLAKNAELMRRLA